MQATVAVFLINLIGHNTEKNRKERLDILPVRQKRASGCCKSSRGRSEGEGRGKGEGKEGGKESLCCSTTRGPLGDWERD